MRSIVLTIHDSRLDKILPPCKNCLSSLGIRHSNFIAPRSDYSENRAKFIMQSMFVIERPSHVGTSSPRAKAEGKIFQFQHDGESPAR